jgi:hypothetical protein
MSATVADAVYAIAEVVGNGVQTSDARIIPRINDATRRLMSEGLFVGMIADVRICARQQCFTLPRILENAIDFYIPDSRLDVPNGWYSVESQSGYVDPEAINDIALVDMGEVPTSFDVCGAQFLKVYSDVGETDAFLRILGYDQNNAQLYSAQPQYQAGILLPITTAGSLSIQQFNQVTGIQKPQTNGPVSLYAVDPTTLDEVLIARYEPSETNPSYRRYFCSDIPSNSDGTPVIIRVTGKKRFVYVQNMSDLLIIPNISALKLEVLSIERQLSSDLQGAELYHKQAVEMLKMEAKNYQLDPSRTTTRKAQLLVDEQTYSFAQLGHVRARLALELPNLLKVGLRTITRIVNEAQERLVSQGHWRATVGQFNLQIYENGYIVLPSMAESILTAHIGRHPFLIRNQWFEATENGPGLTTNNSYSEVNVIDRGYGPTFFDLTETSQVTVISSGTEVPGTAITITGLDQDGIPAVESVPTGGSSVTNFSKVTNLQKGLTVGFITLQSVDHQVLAILQPTDVSPTFHRYFVAGLGHNFDPQTVVNCQLKLKPSWVHMPSDFLVIHNYGAIKTMVQAIAMENATDPQLDKSLVLEKKAVQILNDQLKNSRGGSAQQLNVQLRGFGPRRVIQPR